MSETTIKLAELLPCPFDGGNAHFGTVRFGKNAVPKQDRDKVNHFVSCDLCNATTQTITGYGTQEEAAKKWNQRAALNESNALRAEVEAYRQLLGETFKLKLDDDTEIYRGAWGYQCSELPSDESYDSIIEIWNAIKGQGEQNGND